MQMNKDRSRSLFALTWPIFVELALQMLVGNVDQFMVGQVSQSGVAAIGNANQIINVLILTFSVISMATTILVAQYLGSNNQKAVSQIYTLAIVVNLITSLVVGVILVGCSGALYRWMQVPEGLMAESTAYITIIGGFIFLQAISLTFSAIFRSNALMKETMLVSVVVNVVNIGGNALLIPSMGVAGAAISSNVSRIAGILIILYLYKTRIGVPISLSQLRPFPTGLLKKLLAIGLPSGGESLSYNMTQVVIMKYVNSFGTWVITTKVYGSMFAMLSYLYASAVAQASQILVGYQIGAGELEDANKQVWSTIRSSVLVSTAISTLLWLLSDLLFGFFTKDPQVVALGKTILLIEIPLEIGRAVNIGMVRSLQAAGDIKFPITVGIISMWVVAVGLSYYFGVVLGLGLGLVGIWLGMMTDELLRAGAFLLRWKSGAWRTKKLVG